MGRGMISGHAYSLINCYGPFTYEGGDNLRLL